MDQFRKASLSLLLAVIEFVAVACGNQSSRVLQSVSVSPATADARNFANGQVQFTASGNYNQPPTPSTLTQAEWSLDDPTIATVSQTGLAQCNPGASGTVTVKAGTSGSCSGPDCTAVFVSGTAQLSCP